MHLVDNMTNSAPSTSSTIEHQLTSGLLFFVYLLYRSNCVVARICKCEKNVSSTTPKCSPLFLLQSISFFFITADTLANNLIVTFRAWDEFQSLDYKLNSVFDGLAFRTGYQGAKCLVQLSCSSHRLPRSLVTKELRITKNQEIECFVLNEEVRVDRTIFLIWRIIKFCYRFLLIHIVLRSTFRFSI